MPEGLQVAVRHRRGAFSLDVAFHINRWPAVLFGPSGAGKSTLLRVIAGLDHAKSATITLGQTALKPSACLVQMVAQRPALFPHLTVAQNVAFGLMNVQRRERHARVREMLALLGAEAFADRRPASLSGGERQRVAIARALAPDPKLLLLDEAFAGLDSGAKQEILEQLNALLRERDIAMLYVTHEVADAFALDAEVVVMQQGRIVGQARAEEALAREREHLLASLGQLAVPARP